VSEWELRVVEFIIPRLVWLLFVTHLALFVIARVKAWHEPHQRSLGRFLAAKVLLWGAAWGGFYAASIHTRTVVLLAVAVTTLDLLATMAWRYALPTRAKAWARRHPFLAALAYVVGTAVLIGIGDAISWLRE
jgi:vacuolar-type H+-ATPase subunit I/STV1